MGSQRFFRFNQAIILVAIFLFPVFGEASPASKFGVIPVRPARIAPEFSLKDPSGKEISLSDYKGKIVLINFWATWCAPCLEEMPGFVKLHESYKDKDLVLLAVSEDKKKETVLKTMKKFEIPFQVLLDPRGEVASKYGARGLPMTFYINRQGKIEGMITGPRAWTSGPANAWIESTLKVGNTKSPSIIKTELKSSQKLITKSSGKNDQGIEMFVSGPQVPVTIDEAFVVQIKVKWPGDPETYAVAPPEVKVPEGLTLFTAGTHGQTDGKFTLLTSDYYFVPKEALQKKGMKTLVLGPFESSYIGLKGEGSVSSGPIQVELAGNFSSSFSTWKLLLVMVGFLGLLGMGGYSLIQRKKKKNGENKPSTEKQSLNHEDDYKRLNQQFR